MNWIGSSKCEIQLFLNPVPASRPRVTRWGTYYGKTYKRWMADALDALPPAQRTFEGPVRVALDFHVKKPRTSRLAWPRGDADNYSKGVLDVLQKRQYVGDDNQVVTLHVTKQFARSDGMVRVVITDAE